jgi:hypothetical protein
MANQQVNTFSAWAMLAGKEKGKQRKPGFLNDGDKYLDANFVTNTGEKYYVKLFPPKAGSAAKYDYSGRVQLKDELDGYVTIAWVKLYKSDRDGQTHYGYISIDKEYSDNADLQLEFCSVISLNRTEGKVKGDNKPNFSGSIEPNMKELKKLGLIDDATPYDEADAIDDEGF